MKRNTVVMRLVAAALFSAMIMILTLLSWRLPMPQGAYIHAGDSMIYACSWFIGGFYAAAAAAIGSVLADTVLTSYVYIPATLVVKFLMGLVCAYMFKRLGDKLWSILLVSITGSLIMLVGYLAYDWMLFGREVAIVSALYGLIQFIAGVGIALPLILALKKVKALETYRYSMRE